MKFDSSRGEVPVKRCFSKGLAEQLGRMNSGIDTSGRTDSCLTIHPNANEYMQMKVSCSGNFLMELR